MFVDGRWRKQAFIIFESEGFLLAENNTEEGSNNELILVSNTFPFTSITFMCSRLYDQDIADGISDELF